MIVNRTITKNLLLQKAGKKEGGLGEGIFARLLTAPKARLGWERLRPIAPSREAKQNIFQFLLEEKVSRAKIEKREKCFALRRRQAGGAAGRVNSVQSRFALRSVIATIRLQSSFHFSLRSWSSTGDKIVNRFSFCYILKRITGRSVTANIPALPARQCRSVVQW